MNELSVDTSRGEILEIHVRPCLHRKQWLAPPPPAGVAVWMAGRRVGTSRGGDYGDLRDPRKSCCLGVCTSPCTPMLLACRPLPVLLLACRSVPVCCWLLAVSLPIPLLLQFDVTSPRMLLLRLVNSSAAPIPPTPPLPSPSPLCCSLT